MVNRYIAGEASIGGLAMEAEHGSENVTSQRIFALLVQAFRI